MVKFVISTLALNIKVVEELVCHIIGLQLLFDAVICIILIAS